jgi:hypothetical protein
LVALQALGGCRALGGSESHPEIDPSYGNQFGALTAAVDDDDDDTARRILAGIYARRPKGDTLRVADKYDRILRGRRLVTHLEFSLVGVRDEERSETVVYLEARHDLSTPVTLHSSAGTLRRVVNAITPDGRGLRNEKTLAVEGVSELSLSPGQAIRIEVDRFALQAGSSLAVRARWDLDLAAAHAEAEPERIPVNDVPVAPYLEVRTASYLPADPVEPIELANYLEGVGRFRVEAMLERAVRIEPARWQEALDLVTPVVLGGSTLEVGRAVPALIWLTGNYELGRDPRVWQSLLRTRSRERSSEPQPDLSLPRTTTG